MRMIPHLLRFFFVPFFGLILWKLVYELVHDGFFLIPLLIFIAVVMSLVFWGWTHAFETKLYKQTKKWNSYSMTALGYLITISLIVFYFYMDSRLKAESLYIGFHDDGPGSSAIDLKKNGEVIFSRCLFGCSYEYGTYIIEDSVVTIYDIEELYPSKFKLEQQVNGVIIMTPTDVDSSSMSWYTYTIYKK